MSWQWHRNQDGVDVVTDSVTFVRDTTACPARGAGMLLQVERLNIEEHVLHDA